MKTSLWYKDAVIYQLHVKAYADGNGDGIGDFVGLRTKLDYLQRLGITAVWLLPFYPSPLRDDGYDISDYLDVHPQYGTLDDFKRFLKAAHEVDIRVIAELVLNHTSISHPWFQKSRHSKPNSSWWNYYVWSDTPHRYADARIIFKDFETSNWTYDPEAQAYYWHRFFSHQPDLNYENPEVRKAMFKVVDFWLELGVDGLRLDAVPYLFEKEGTDCENLPTTHEFLRELRSHVDANYSDKLLLAEANQWPEDAVAYMSKGDECHMAFHFPLMPRMFMALHMEESYPIIDILDQTPAIPDNCQWATFLRNHDELTLEMVTDEERDYMYRVYAQNIRSRVNLGIRRRLVPLLGCNRLKVELMNTLLMSLPGTPILYYGDEIGMGDNIFLGDRNSLRTPMQWSADKNAGFSRANPQQLYLPIIIDPEYHYEAVNVDIQEANLSSLLWWMRKMIAMRKRFKALSRGDLRFLKPDNSHILAFIRSYQQESILVVINLSRFAQSVVMDLSIFAGKTPVEAFSRSSFQIIGKEPYMMTLGSYDAFWLLLHDEKSKQITVPAEPLVLQGAWEELFDISANRECLENDVFPQYLRHARWFGSKARNILKITITDHVPMRMSKEEKPVCFFLLLEVSYTEGLPDFYTLPIRVAHEATGADKNCILARFEQAGQTGFLIDALFDQTFRDALLLLIVQSYRMEGARGMLVGKAISSLRLQLKTQGIPQDSITFRTEQSNSAFVYGNTFFLKFYRRVEDGINPEAEMIQYLSRYSFSHAPGFLGKMEYRSKGSSTAIIGLLQPFLPGSITAWEMSLASLRALYRQSMPPSVETHDVFANAEAQTFVKKIALLAQITADLHNILAAETKETAFIPEPFNLFYQRSVYQSIRANMKQAFRLLAKSMAGFEKAEKDMAQDCLGFETQLAQRLKALLQKSFLSMRTRIHGDFHLGQVLCTNDNFVIIDFEGEPARPTSERRIKHSPLRDVAGMLRSIDYATYQAVYLDSASPSQSLENRLSLAAQWSKYLQGVFTRDYLSSVKSPAALPSLKTDIETLLQLFLLDKVFYEISYELNNRPTWLHVPLWGLKHLIAYH